MGDRQNKILGESVEKGKCQIIVIKGTIQRVQGHIAVSYTHLDVYKRQAVKAARRFAASV